MEIVVFTQPGCPTCMQVKGFLKAQGHDFQERDVRQDDEALETLHQLGFQATPLTLVNGTPILGMNRQRFAEALGGLREQTAVVTP